MTCPRFFRPSSPVSLTLGALLVSSVLAHGGHLELGDAYLEQEQGLTQLHLKVRYPQSDQSLSLQAVSGATFTATLEVEKNGRWHKITAIPITGDLELNRDSAYRVTLPPDFDFAAQRGQRLPISFVFGQGGVQVLEVSVGKPRGNALWSTAGLLTLGLALGVLGRVLWGRSRRSRRQRR